MRDQFAAGIAWGQAKKELFALINEEIREARERYDALLADGAKIEAVLAAGATRARAEARQLLDRLRHAVGIRPLV